MKGADIVIHTAAALPLYTPEDIYTTDIVGTRNVLEQAIAIWRKAFHSHFFNRSLWSSRPSSSI